MTYASAHALAAAIKLADAEYRRMHALELADISGTADVECLLREIEREWRCVAGTDADGPEVEDYVAAAEKLWRVLPSDVAAYFVLRFERCPCCELDAVWPHACDDGAE